MGLQIRILIVDDHSLFRQSLSRLLQSEPDFRVVADCASSSEALAILGQQEVDVVLLDYDLGGEPGTVFLRNARRGHFTGSVLMVTAGMGDSEMLETLRAGSAGVFLKHSPPGDLVRAIHKIAAGEMWLDPAAVRAVVAGAKEKNETPDQGQEMSVRERAVLKAVFEGLSNKEIANQLEVTENAVKWVIRRLFEKTGVRSRSQLVRMILEKHDRKWLNSE